MGTKWIHLHSKPHDLTSACKQQTSQIKCTKWKGSRGEKGETHRRKSRGDHRRRRRVSSRNRRRVSSRNRRRVSSRNRQCCLSLSLSHTQEEENEKKEATTRSLSLSVGNKTGADFEIQQYKWVPHKESPNPKTKDPHLARNKSTETKIICTNLKLIKRLEKRMMQHRKIIRLPDSSYQ